MNTYEMVLITTSEVGEKVKTTVTKAIEEVKGKLEKEKSLGEREFFYPIKKETKGSYLLFNFSLDPKNVRELSRNLKLKEEILRFLIIKK